MTSIHFRSGLRQMTQKYIKYKNLHVVTGFCILYFEYFSSALPRSDSRFAYLQILERFNSMSDLGPNITFEESFVDVEIVARRLLL